MDQEHINEPARSARSAGSSNTIKLRMPTKPDRDNGGAQANTDVSPFDYVRSILTADEMDAARELYRLFMISSRITRQVHNSHPNIDILQALGKTGCPRLSTPDTAALTKLVRFRDSSTLEMWRVAEAYFECTREYGMSVPTLHEIGCVVLHEDAQLVAHQTRMVMGAGAAITRALLWQFKAFNALHEDLIAQERTEADIVAQLESQRAACQAAQAALRARIDRMSSRGALNAIRLK